MSVDVSIIIVNWNGRELLAKCIESILEHPPSASFEIVVVDNASTDGSVEWLRAARSQGRLKETTLRLIENKENVGFGRANNIAFNQTSSRMVFLLNSDTEVREGAIDRLVETLKSGEKAGGCGPKLLNTDGSLQPSVYRNPPTVWEILITGLRFHYLLPRRIRAELLLGPYWDHSKRRKTRMLHGGAMLLRREVIDSVGGFDEEFHFYGEDIELCARIVNSGWELIFEPDAQVVHHDGKSALVRWDSEERQRRLVDGILRCYRKSLPGFHFVANCLASCLVFFLERIWRRARGVPTKDIDVLSSVHRKHLREVVSGLVPKTFRLNLKRYSGVRKSKPHHFARFKPAANIVGAYLGYSIGCKYALVFPTDRPDETDLLQQFFRVILLEPNTGGGLHIDPAILGEAIVESEVSCDGESGLPEAIAQAANAARVSVIVEKHASESTTTAIHCLSRSLARAGLRPEFIGTMGMADAHTHKAIAIIHNRSPLINGANQAAPASFRVVAIMAVYNEIDIIVRSVEKLLAQGVEVYLIDNWSTDGTYEAVRDLLGSKLAGLERFPAGGYSGNYDLHSLLLRKEEIANTLRADWFVHCDADEIRYGPWQGVSMRDAIYYVDQEGYNAIDHTIIEFHPVDDNFQAGEDFENYFRYFSFYKGATAAEGSDIFQLRTWKNTGRPISLASTGGHEIIFEGRRIYPYKFLLKHYPIRSQEHGAQKVFQARLPRFLLAAKARGWHVHYDALKEDHNFLKDAATLTRFEADQFYTSYLVQRLTGIGTLFEQGGAN